MVSLVELFPMTTANPVNMVPQRLESAAMGVFDGSKHSLVSPVSSSVEVPLIDKRSGQVISLSDELLQIMDLETFEVFETTLIDNEIKDKIRQGAEVEYWKVLEKVKIVPVK